MKKIFTLALALCLLVSAALPALAETVTYPFGLTGDETYPEAVEALTEYFRDAKGTQEKNGNFYIEYPGESIHGFNIRAISVKIPEDGETFESISVYLLNPYNADDVVGLAELYVEMMELYGMPLGTNPIKKTKDISGRQHVYTITEQFDQLTEAFMDEKSSFEYEICWNHAAMNITKNGNKSVSIFILWNFAGWGASEE